MSKASPKVIGAFVLGGMALLAIGIVVFGGARWLQSRQTVIAFFPGSINGLRVGAPVTFRGVAVGQVTDIKVLFEPQAIEARIPVIFDLDPNSIVEVGDDLTVSDAELRDRLVAKGLRAQLGMESFVTGLLAVNLDFVADAPPPAYQNRPEFDLPYPEVPTVPSGLEELQANAGEIAQQLTAVLNSLNGILGDITTAADGNRHRVDSVMESVAMIADGLGKVTPKLAGLVDETSRTAAAVARTADTAHALMHDNAGTIKGTLADLRDGIAALRRMADQINNMVAENREGVRDFTQTGLYEVTGLAEDAQRMVDQITRVMEDLERDPARFLFGNRNAGVRAE